MQFAILWITQNWSAISICLKMSIAFWCSNCFTTIIFASAPRRCFDLTAPHVAATVFFQRPKSAKKGLEYFSPPPTTSKSNINAWTPHLFFFCLHHTIRLFASSFNQYHSATKLPAPSSCTYICSINPPTKIQN